MKVLIVGGAHQGKDGYARTAFGAVTVDRLHHQVWIRLERGEDACADLLRELEGLDHWVVLCDEVGLGVVPMDPFQRRWREEVGRLCCLLAQRAHIVERVTCGLPLRLKGDGNGTL